MPETEVERCWLSFRREDGSPDPRGTLGSIFQDGYHSGRALLRCEQLLDRLAAEP